jgi:protein kinase-like protein
MQEQSTRAASPELRPGEEFAGHRIEGVLGRGGMGVVYRAVDLRLERRVALKLITPALSADEDFRRRFQRESQLAASVRQPNVVTIYQAGEADGLLFVTMELIQGKDLRAVLTERGRLDLPTATAIVSQIAAALDAAHASGLVHRDVKPGNVLIGAAAPLHVYLTDFGLTKRTSSQSGITKTGLFVGTIDYAAPEQIKGWPVDARADVYALGCVLFEMVAGQPPFRRENEYATMYAHTSEPPPALTSVAPGAPPALDGAIGRALAKEPGDRFPSAGDLARAVNAAVAGQAPAEPERTVAVGRAAPPPAPPTIAEPHPVYGYGLEPQTQQIAPPPPPPARRNPWTAVLAVLAVLLVAGAVAAAVLIAGNDDTTPAPGPTPNPPPNVPGGPTAQQGVTQIAEVLDLSRRGRTLTASGNYSAAIDNRRQVLQQLDGLELVPELEPSRTLLKAAMRASIDADEALIQCTDCPSTRSANEHASALKNDFAIEFNPFARKYLNQQFDPGSF